MAWEMWTLREDPAHARLVERPCADGARPVEMFALTANNLTYAATGSALGYWDLFPTEAGWGIVPAWGYAGRDGDALFGLMPMASHVRLECRQSRSGFRETSEGRAHLSPAYNLYAAAGGETLDRVTNAGLRPLLIASFTLDAYLKANDDFDAECVFILGASSKTALGLAMATGGRMPVFGATANAGAIDDLQFYNALRGYDDFTPWSGPRALVVDFVGDDQKLAKTLALLGNRAVRVVRIGWTHWRASSSSFQTLKTQDGSTPLAQSFFAPDHIVALARQWGPDLFEQRLVAFIEAFAAHTRHWLQYHYLDGPRAILDGWRQIANDGAAAQKIFIARPHGPA